MPFGIDHDDPQVAGYAAALVTAGLPDKAALLLASWHMDLRKMCVSHRDELKAAEARLARTIAAGHKHTQTEVSELAEAINDAHAGLVVMRGRLMAPIHDSIQVDVPLDIPVDVPLDFELTDPWENPE